MKALAFLLVFASVAVAQLPPQAPPLNLPPQAPEVVFETPYARATAEAITSNKWLMVFIGCKERHEPNYVTVQVPTLDGYDGPCVILARPENGSMYYHSTEARALTPDPFRTVQRASFQNCST